MMSDHRTDLSWILLPIFLTAAVRPRMSRGLLPATSVLVAFAGAAVMIWGSLGGLEYLPADAVRLIVKDNVGMYASRALVAGAVAGTWAFHRSATGTA